MTGSEEPVKDIIRRMGFDYESISIKQLFGSSLQNVYKADVTLTGNRHQKCVIKFCKTAEENKLFIFTTDTDGEFAVDTMERERHLLEEIRNHTSIPVPQVIETSRSPSGEIPPALTLEYVRGEPLGGAIQESSTEIQRQIMHEVGFYLGSLQDTFQFDSYGMLQLDNGMLVVDGMDSWGEWFESRWQTAIEQLTETPYADMIPELKAWYDDQPDPAGSDQPPVLIHGDFRAANILVTKSTNQMITAILDWESVAAATSGFQLALVDQNLIDEYASLPEEQEQLRESLHKGYRETAPFSLDRTYRERQLLYHCYLTLWKMGNFNLVHGDKPEEAQEEIAQHGRERMRQLLEDN